MSWTKKQIVDEAFAELALQGYEFDISPEEQQTALRRLDLMFADWEARGVRVGYLFPSSPSASELDSISGIPDYAAHAAILNLAVMLGPGFGKAVSADTKSAAKSAYDALLWAAAHPQQQQLPERMPKGAGNKPWRTTNRPFVPRPDESPLRVSSGGDLDILSE